MSFNYTAILPFEQTFDPVPSTVWMQNYWWHSVTVSILYAITIYCGQRFMKERSSFDLKQPLIWWNSILALFSIAGAIRYLPDFVYVLLNYGFDFSICVSSYTTGVTGFWTQLFAFSKVLELLDTAFIILRKRPLIFLHWYHHITVLVYTWHAYKDHTAAGRWFVMMNYVVHAFMYSYYAFRAAGFWFPKWVPMSVTSLQIAQMLIGCVIAVKAFMIKKSGGSCQQTMENLRFSFFIYLSYFMLFAWFYYNAYLRPNSKRSKPHANGSANGHLSNGVTHAESKSKKDL